MRARRVPKECHPCSAEDWRFTRRSGTAREVRRPARGARFQRRLHHPDLGAPNGDADVAGKQAMNRDSVRRSHGEVHLARLLLEHRQREVARPPAKLPGAVGRHPAVVRQDRCVRADQPVLGREDSDPHVSRPRASREQPLADAEQVPVVDVPRGEWDDSASLALRAGEDQQPTVRRSAAADVPAPSREHKARIVGRAASLAAWFLGPEDSPTLPQEGLSARAAKRPRRRPAGGGARAAEACQRRVGETGVAELPRAHQDTAAAPAPANTGSATSSSAPSGRESDAAAIAREWSCVATCWSEPIA